MKSPTKVFFEPKLSDNYLLELLPLKGKKNIQLSDSGSWEPLVYFTCGVPKSLSFNILYCFMSLTNYMTNKGGWTLTPLCSIISEAKDHIMFD